MTGCSTWDRFSPSLVHHFVGRDLPGRGLNGSGDSIEAPESQPHTIVLLVTLERSLSTLFEL